MSIFGEMGRRLRFIYSEKPEVCPWPPMPWELQAVHRRFSPLTARIMAVNIIALAIIGASLMFLGQYKDQLIDSEMKALQLQANMSSRAVAASAVVVDKDEKNILSPLLARLMIRRLAEVTEAHTRLFDMEDRVIADSHVLLNMEGFPAFLPRRTDSWLMKNAMNVLNAFEMFRKQREFHHYQEQTEFQTQTYDIVQTAQKGEPATCIWKLPKGDMLLSVAVPVKRYNQVLGVLMLSRPDTNIEAAMYETRVTILRIFAVTILVTMLLSFYLARAITQPVKRLAKAAETVRLGQAQEVGLSGSARLLNSEVIPDFSSRHDEIGDLSVALREMTAALARRLGAIENFAADVAHEIKNPLTSLRSAVETASIIKDPEKQQKLMKVILHDVNRLDRLISDISNASRLDAELTRDQATSIDLYKMLETLIDYYSGHEGADVKLSDLSVSDIKIAAVEERLFQVLQNLIDNALTFTPEGGSVILTMSRQDSYVEIMIEDSGPGIPETKLDTIFERFYTERPKTEAFGNHSGLGLSISRQIVEAHQGKIWAENRRDDEGNVLGARFVVRLPLLS